MRCGVVNFESPLGSPRIILGRVFVERQTRQTINSWASRFGQTAKLLASELALRVRREWMRVFK